MAKQEERDKRLDEVIRVKKCKSNFVTMDKSFLEDERLSYKAKGILAYLLSKPNNWKVIVGNLVNNSADGKAAVYAGLKELKENGYYEKIPIRNEQGTRILRWESTIYENPSLALTPEHKKALEISEKKEKSKERKASSLLTDFQEIENQDIENQFIENRERNNNYNNNKLNINNNKSSLSVCQDREDKTDIDTYINQIKINIKYQDFQLSHEKDMDFVNTIVSIILDVFSSKSSTVTIDREQKSREFVKSTLLKLNYEDIETIIAKYKSIPEKVKNPRKYILTMLFNVKLEEGLNSFNQTNLLSTATKSEKKVTNKFNDFPQREYNKSDFDELERKLLAKRLAIS